MDGQLITNFWDIKDIVIPCWLLGRFCKVSVKRRQFLNVWVSEFDFLLIEAPLPRCCKKSKRTKQLVATGHEYVSLQPSFCCTSLVEFWVAIHSGTKSCAK